MFDELDVLNHIYIFCACALPKKDSDMDEKIPLRHIYIINHIDAYNCNLMMSCRNKSKHKWRHEYITNDDGSPLVIENNRSIVPLFLSVKSIFICSHVCDIRLCDWLPGMVASSNINKKSQECLGFLEEETSFCVFFFKSSLKIFGRALSLLWHDKIQNLMDTLKFNSMFPISSIVSVRQ